MATCKEVHTSVYKGVTTVVRCDQRPDHGTCHSAVVAWYAVVPVPENWQPGDVVMDKHKRVYCRTLMGHWWRPGILESFDDDYPTRPLVKLTPEKTP